MLEHKAYVPCKDLAHEFDPDEILDCLAHVYRQIAADFDRASPGGPAAATYDRIAFLLQRLAPCVAPERA